MTKPSMDKLVYLPPDENGVRWSECGRFWYWPGWEHGFYTNRWGTRDTPPLPVAQFVPDLRSEAEKGGPGADFPTGDFRERLKGRQPRTPETIAILAMDLLQNYLDGRLDYSGGYPAEVDWDSFLNVVVVADLDPAKEYHRPCLAYYDKRKLSRLAEEALDQGPIDEHGRRLKGAARIEAICAYFDEYVDEECLADSDDPPEKCPSDFLRGWGESEPDPAEGEAR